MDYWPEFDSKLDFQYNCLLSQTTIAENHRIYNQSQMRSVTQRTHSSPGNSHDTENSKRSKTSIAWIVIVEALVRLVLGKCFKLSKLRVLM